MVKAHLRTQNIKPLLTYKKVLSSQCIHNIHAHESLTDYVLELTQLNPFKLTYLSSQHEGFQECCPFSLGPPLRCAGWPRSCCHPLNPSHRQGEERCWSELLSRTAYTHIQHTVKKSSLPTSGQLTNMINNDNTGNTLTPLSVEYTGTLML